MFSQNYLLKLLIIIYVLLNQTACVFTMSRPTANASSPVSIHAANFDHYNWNLPLGVKMVTEYDMAVRKSHNIGNGTMFSVMLFGPIIMPVIYSSMPADTATVIKGMDSFAELKLKNMATEILRETYENGQMPVNLTLKASVNNDDAFKIQPFLLLETDEITRTDLMLILRVTQGEGRWKGQYTSHIFGMAEINNIHYSEEFRDAVKYAMKQSLMVFYQDIKGQLEKNDEAIVPIVQKSMYFSQPPLWGWELSSPKEELFLFQTKLTPESMFGGVHIFNSGDVTIKPSVEKEEDTSDSIVTTSF